MFIVLLINYSYTVFLMLNVSGKTKTTIKTITAALLVVIALFVSFWSYNYYSLRADLDSLEKVDGRYFGSGKIVISLLNPSGNDPFVYILDGRKLTGEIRRGNNRVSLHLDNLSPGRHVLFIETENRFNLHTFLPVKGIAVFHVDTEPPPIKISFPDKSLIHEEEIYLTGKTEPNCLVDISVNKENYRTSADGEGNFYQKIFIYDETNDLIVKSTDKAGNTSSERLRLVLDNTPPALSVKAPLPGQVIKTNEKTISVEVTDTGSGIEKCYMEVDGKIVDGNYDPEKGTLSIRLSNMDEGIYVVKTVAFDRAGLKSEFIWSFIVDSTEELGHSRIRPGARGKDVEKVQKLLKELGLLDENQVNGIYDTETTRAILAIQGKRGLEPTGILDEKTLLSITNKVFIYLDEFALYLISPDDHIIKKYPIAVGTPYYPTPTGKYFVKEKIYYPVWYPPDSPWAKGAKPIPPGWGNPLGTRWIGLDKNIVGIHGTPSSWSIGRAASHGCIRMYIHQVEELFELVDIGTPVNIYASRPEGHEKYRVKKKSLSKDTAGG